MFQSVGPVKGEVSRAMQMEMFQAIERFLETWLVPRFNPPHDKVFVLKCGEPLTPPCQKAIVYGFKYECLQACQILPDRQVGHKLRIATGCAFGVARVRLSGAFHHPDKPRHAFAQPVDTVKVVYEFGDTRVVCRRNKASDIQFGKTFRHWCVCRFIPRLPH